MATEQDVLTSAAATVEESAPSTPTFSGFHIPEDDDSSSGRELPYWYRRAQEEKHFRSKAEAEVKAWQKKAEEAEMKNSNRIVFGLKGMCIVLLFAVLVGVHVDNKRNTQRHLDLLEEQKLRQQAEESVLEWKKQAELEEIGRRGGEQESQELKKRLLKEEHQRDSLEKKAVALQQQLTKANAATAELQHRQRRAEQEVEQWKRKVDEEKNFRNQIEQKATAAAAELQQSQRRADQEVKEWKTKAEEEENLRKEIEEKATAADAELQQSQRRADQEVKEWKTKAEEEENLLKEIREKATMTWVCAQMKKSNRIVFGLCILLLFAVLVGVYVNNNFNNKRNLDLLEETWSSRLKHKVHQLQQKLEAEQDLSKQYEQQVSAKSAGLFNMVAGCIAAVLLLLLAKKAMQESGINPRQ